MWENGGIMALPTIPPAAQKRPAQAVQDPSHASFEAVRAGPREARKRDPSLDIPASQKQPRRTIKVMLAQPRGFCAGVVRAIEIVERALEKYGPPVYVRHEIVHNRFVVDSLKAKGAIFVEELSEVPQGAVTIFSAHGVAKSVVRVQSEQDVAALDISPDTPVAYVTQTTLSVDDTRGIIAALERRYRNIVGPETRDICYATQNRQSAVRELSHHVDVILVVGAKNSSNSNRLREIGAEAGIPSYLIADGSELMPE